MKRESVITAVPILTSIEYNEELVKFLESCLDADGVLDKSIYIKIGNSSKTFGINTNNSTYTKWEGPEAEEAGDFVKHLIRLYKKRIKELEKQLEAI